MLLINSILFEVFEFFSINRQERLTLWKLLKKFVEMEDETGVEPSLDVQEIQDYLKQVIIEVKR